MHTFYLADNFVNEAIHFPILDVQSHLSLYFNCSSLSYAKCINQRGFTLFLLSCSLGMVYVVQQLDTLFYVFQELLDLIFSMNVPCSRAKDGE